jgi:hypothetical protein
VSKIIHIIHIRFLNISLEKLGSIRIIRFQEKQPIRFLKITILCRKIGVRDAAARKGDLYVSKGDL